MSNSNIVCLNLVSCNNNIILTANSSTKSLKSMVLNYYVAYPVLGKLLLKSNEIKLLVTSNIFI